MSSDDVPQNSGQAMSSKRLSNATAEIDLNIFSDRVST